MKTYLKIVGHENFKYDPQLGAVILKNNKDIILAVRNNKGVYVEGNKDNIRSLFSDGYCYIEGRAEVINGSFTFFPFPPQNFVQLKIGNLGSFNLEDSKYDIDVYEAYRNISPYLDSISKEISDTLSSKQAKIFNDYRYSEKSGCYFFDVFQDKPGFVRGVHLVHDRLGICSIAIRKNHSERKIIAVLEPKWTVLTLEDTSLKTL